MEFDSAVAALRRYSLIEVQDGRLFFSVHRLVQAVIRSRLPTAMPRASGLKPLWARQMLLFRLDRRPLTLGALLPRLLSHAYAAAEHSERLGVGLQNAGHL